MRMMSLLSLLITSDLLYAAPSHMEDRKEPTFAIAAVLLYAAPSHFQGPIADGPPWLRPIEVVEHADDVAALVIDDSTDLLYAAPSHMEDRKEPTFAIAASLLYAAPSDSRG
jgi:hypothetical protein